MVNRCVFLLKRYMLIEFKDINIFDNSMLFFTVIPGDSQKVSDRQEVNPYLELEKCDH